MMKLVILVALFALLASALDAREEFEAYIQQYNKKYSPDEYHLRFANFQQSLVRSAASNKGGALFGITKFSDMSPEEFQSKVLMSEPIKTVPSQKEDFAPIEGLPATFDWRDKHAVSAVKNQADCGSCWAFSATEAIESTNILKGKAQDSINLSPQQIVDCDHDFVFGCNGGRPSSAYHYIISVGGQEDMKDYPYTAKDGSCKFNKSDIEVSIASYQSIAHDETALQANLVNIGPLSICVDASKWQDYKSGVMQANECCTLDFCKLDHCVQLVGYNVTGNYWAVRNSWAADWGIDGYIHLEIGHNTCGLLDEMTWPSV